MQRRILTVALFALVSVALTWRLTVLAQWSWFQDDWVYVSDAVGQPFSSYIVQSYNGHLMPGQFAIVWVWTHLAPLEFAPAILTVLALSMTSVIVWILALTEIFGRRLWVLFPVSVLCLSPVFLPTSLWVAAALQTFSLQASMGATLLFAVRWWRSGRTVDLLLMAAAYCIGLVFWEKALLITIPVIGIVSVLVARRGTGGWLRLRWPTVILAVLSAAYLVAYLYLTAADSAQRPGFHARSIGEVFDYFRTGLLSSALPAIMGGPWAGQQSLLDVSPAPTQWQVLVILLGGCVVTFFAVLYRRGAWIPLLTGMVYVAGAWGMVMLSSRYTSIGTFGILDARYVVDSVAVLTLMAAVMLFPVRDEQPDAVYRFAVSPRAWRGIESGAALLATAVALSALYTNAAVWDRVSPASPRSWVAAATQALTAGGTGAVYDSRAPDRVALSWAFPEQTRISSMFRALRLPVAFNGAAPRLVVLNDDGEATWAEVGEGIRSLPGPVEDCGYLIKPGETAFVPMNSPAYFWDWGVNVDYWSARGGTLRIKTDTLWSEVPLPAGVGTMQSVIADRASALLLSSTDGSGPICVGQVSFGEVKPGDPVAATTDGASSPSPSAHEPRIPGRLDPED